MTPCRAPKPPVLAAAVMACLAWTGLPVVPHAMAQQVIDSYTARIGAEDRRNSSGVPLDRVEQILQQDRANVHRFGITQDGDSADGFFNSRENRALMSRLLTGRQIAPEVRAAILAGQNPLLRIEIHGSQPGRALFVTVTLAETAAPPRTPPTAPPSAQAESTEARPGRVPGVPAPGAQTARTTAPAGVPSGPLRRDPAPVAQVAGVPPFAPELGCALTQRGAHGYDLRCRGVDGQGVPSGRLQGARAQLVMHTLGCEVAVIDGYPNRGGAAACFFDLFGMDQTRLTPRQVLDLTTVSSFARREDVLLRLARIGYIEGGPRDMVAVSRTTRAQETVPAALEELVWDAYGLRLGERDRRAFIAAVRSGGPAAQQGLGVGDVLDGNGITGANRTRLATLTALKQALEQTPETGLLLYLVPAGARFQDQVTLVPATGDGPGLSIPAALRDAMLSPGFAALMRGDTSAPPRDIDIAAMDALWAMSHHHLGCARPGGVTIPISVSRTTTTRDGTGIIRDTQTDHSMTEITVRRAFAPWTRDHIDLFREGVMTRTSRAVLNMITVEGCTGAGMAVLDRALSTHIGVPPRRAAAPATPPLSEAIPPTRDAFMATCIPMQQDHARRHGMQSVPRGDITNCFCLEHAGRATGDPEVYASLQEVDMIANTGFERLRSRSPALQERFGADFSACYRAPSGSELRLEIEAIWRRMGI